MSTIFFWKEWNKTDRILYLSYLFLFVSAFVMLAYAFVYGRSEVIQLGQDQEASPVKTIIAKTQHNLHDFNVEADQYIVAEQYVTTPLQINPVYSYIYLGMIMLAMIMILTVITYLDLWYYLAAMTIFLLYLAYMQTELLGVFGMSNKNFLIGLILAYAVPSFLLRSYSTHRGILRRLLIFIAITIVFLACIYTGSTHIKHPLLFVPNIGIILPICITIVFLIVIGFDIIKAFLHMVSTGRAEQKKNSLLNFLLISCLYIFSIILTFLKKTNIISWNIIYINVFLFYTVAAIYGIWAYKKRNILFADILPFRPLGALFYLSLGIVSTSTMAYAFITANDPLIEALEYGIYFSQICLSIIFIVYILINFLRFFPTNLNIFEVVYKANSMPFFMVRGIGVMGIVALYFYYNQFPLRLAQAGYYNAAGDVYYMEKDTLMAKQYYKKGLEHEFQNVRSSYGLALMYEEQEQLGLPKVFYENALVKHKNVESFIGLSNIYYRNEQWFQSMFVLRDGLAFFPKSSELYNNLGVVYEKMNIRDSALFCFEQAYSLRQASQSTPVTNLLYLRLKTGNAEAAKALIPSAEKYEGNIALNTNLTTYRSITGEKVKNNFFVLNKQGKMDNEHFYLNNNYVLNHLGEKDSMITNTILRLQNDSTMAQVRDNLLWLRSLSLYYSGEKIEGLEILMSLNLSNPTPQYQNTIACWMLNEHAYERSAHFFSNLMRYGNQSSALDYTLVSKLSNTHDSDYLVLLDSLTHSQNVAIQKEATDHLTALRAPSFDAVSSSSEKVRYLYLHYHAEELNETDFISIRAGFTQPDLIVLSAVDFMYYYIRVNRADAAGETWKSLEQYPNISPYAMGNAHLAYLDLLVATKKWDMLKEELQDIYLLPQDEGLKKYYSALAYQNTNNKKAALTEYKAAVKACPLNPTVCIAAADYFNKEGDQQDAYDLLQVAITYNRTSAPILIAYCHQAIQMNMPMFAETLLPEMEGIVAPSEIELIKRMIKQANTIE